MFNHSRQSFLPLAIISLPTVLFSLLVTLMLGVLLTGCGQDDAPITKEAVVRPVKTTTVNSTANQLRKTYSAIVSPAQQAELSFRVSGKIIKLPINEGMKVKKGDVIAQLDQRDFKADITRLKSDISQANAQMKAMRAGARPEDIAALNAAVKAARSRLNAAQIEFNRTQGLVEKGVLARNTLDKDRSTLEVAQADLDAKKQELRKGKAGGRKEDVSAQRAVIQGLNSQLKSLQDTLADTTLRAPFAGIIATRLVENFSNIQAKETVATLQTFSAELDLVFDVPGADVVQLAADKELDLKVVLESFPNQEFAAKKRAFSTEPDPATQTYQGRVTIKPTEKQPILPGMTGKVIITGKQSNKGSVLVIPLSAIASAANGKPFVWVVNTTDNTTSQRNVTLGEASGAMVIISEGLKIGDVVVTAGVSALQEGMKVKPITTIGE